MARSLGVFVPHPHKHVNPNQVVRDRMTFEDRPAAWMTFQIVADQRATILARFPAEPAEA